MSLPARSPAPAEIIGTTEIVDPSVRVVDAEVVGHEPQPPFLRRLLARAALSFVLGAIGLAAITVGVILTFTVVAAPLGIPLVILGLIICAVALFAPFAREQARFVVHRWPR